MKILRNMLAKRGMPCKGNTKIGMNTNGHVLHVGTTLNEGKIDLTKMQRKKITFISRLNYAERNFCIFILMYTEFMRVRISIKFSRFYQD